MKVEEIGIKIRIERKKSGLTLEQLAQKGGEHQGDHPAENRNWKEQPFCHYPF